MNLYVRIKSPELSPCVVRVCLENVQGLTRPCVSRHAHPNDDLYNESGNDWRVPVLKNNPHNLDKNEQGKTIRQNLSDIKC